MTRSVTPPTRNDSILRRFEPFLVTAPWSLDHFDLRPFDVPIPDDNVILSTGIESRHFLDRLQTLDTLTFGPEGMPMPRWLFYEASGLPGAIFGFACRAEALTAPLAARLELDEEFKGLMPLSMYIAVPAGAPDVWFGHNLASLNRVLPELELRGLGSMTKAMALKVFRCRRQLGATQWDSAAVSLHSRFGPLELLTAWTPAHTEPGTLTYRIEPGDTGLRRALGDPEADVAFPEAELEIATGDVDAMQRLQMRIEAGERFAIAGPPITRADGTVVVPVAGRSP